MLKLFRACLQLCAALLICLPAFAQSTPPKMNLVLMKEALAVARLDPQAPIPAWALTGSSFSSISRTPNELSVVCRESQIPKDVKTEGGWSIFKVEGPLDFELVGILASITGPLAKAGISIFAISTYDTDYVMVKQDKVAAAIVALGSAGHNVRPE